MRHPFNLFVLLYCLAITACGEQIADPVDTASLNLSFRAIYDGEPLVLDTQKYEYKGNAVKFTNITFYLANLVAVNDDGETELSEIQFVNLTATHKTAANAANGTSINFDRIPVGVYKYLRFGIGVPADLNKTSPVDYATSHPLGANNSSEYREDLKSYIFTKIEGQYDRQGDGLNDNDINFSYQVGGKNNLYKTLEIDNELTLNAGETMALNFELDVKRLLTRPFGSLIPIEDYDISDQNEEIQIIMINFEKALQLN